MSPATTAIALLAVAVAAVLPGCASAPSGSGEDDAVEVVASFYPLEFVVDRVAGDAVSVGNMTPPGVEPHDLELSSSQIIDLAEADLVVYLGSGFQPALEDAIEPLDAARRFDVLEKVELLEGAEDDHEHEADEHGSDDQHAAADPHVWLDPSLLAAIAHEVAERLGDLDPANAATFRSRAAELEDQLLDLDEAYAAGLADCQSREFVVSHAAFSYLAARYDLEQVSISGIDPEAEPSPQRLAEIARFVEEHDVRVIFFEELASPALAETLARETGVETDVLSPLETAPAEGGYIEQMTQNLQRLTRALRCE